MDRDRVGGIAAAGLGLDMCSIVVPRGLVLTC